MPRRPMRNQRYVRNESYSGFNSEGFRHSPADPKKKQKPPTVVTEVFICAHYTAAASHFDWPPRDRLRILFR